MSDALGPSRGGDRASGRDESPSWAERLLMAISGVFTVLLFGYVVWQGATTPASAVPSASVVGTEPAPEGVLVTVVLENPQDVGLVTAVVEVDCGDPPPSLTFEHVPADGRRTGYVVCPPEEASPTARLSSWTEA